MRDKDNNIAQQLTVLAAKKYTGILRVKSSNLQQWKIYFRLGRIVWIDSNYHIKRSWQRHLSKYCPKVDISKIINSSVSPEVKYCNYQCLAILFEQKLIDRATIKAIISSIILENLFTIIQQENNRILYYLIESDSNCSVLSSVLKIAFTLVDADFALKSVQNQWQLWQGKGLAKWQPNLAPKIKNKAQLQQQVSANVYRNFVKFIDGNNTLQDLAFQTNRDILEIAISLKNYLERGILELVKVGDISIEIKRFINPKKITENSNKKKRLIVAIDDSKIVGYIMKTIIDRAGYELVNIDRPLQAVPTLIGIKPDLIFLDLAMPIVNGYEICRQIRRVSLFKKVPIVILTSNDGLIEKAKAKAVGATDFLAKPIDEKVILKTIDKYLTRNDRDKIHLLPDGISSTSPTRSKIA